MYRDFYQLTYLPFSAKPAPEALFLSPSRQLAVAPVIRSIQERRGLVALIGEAGLGKTTLLRAYLEKMDQKQLHVLYISNANTSFKNLIRTIYQELGYEYKSKNLSDETVSIIHLHTIFIEAYDKGRNVVLVIDNAQDMPLDTLKKLPLLANIEPYKDSLLQVVLVGQPSLEENLHLPTFSEIKNKISGISHLSPLTNKESVDYIQSKLINASKEAKCVISKRAIRKIAKFSKGIPINLDTISTDVLIYGYQAQKNPIPASIARRVIADFENNSPSQRFVRFGLAGLILLASLAAIWLYSDWRRVTTWLPAVLLPEQAVTTSADRPAVVEERPQEPQPVLPIPKDVSVAVPPSVAISGPSAEVIQEVRTLIHQFFPDGGDFGLQVWPDKGTDGVYAVGEKLLVRIMAETDAYLQVDYYQADGQVVHLLPNPLDSNRVNAGKAFTLGKPENSFQFNIAPPFGMEMLMVLASQRPLDVPRDMSSTEPASVYLARLAKNLKHYRAHEKVAVAYTRIYTQAEMH